MEGTLKKEFGLECSTFTNKIQHVKQLLICKRDACEDESLFSE